MATAAAHVDEVQMVTLSATSLAEVQSVTTSAASGATLGGSLALVLDGVGIQHEKQLVSMAAARAVSSGAFRLGLGGYEGSANATGCIAWDASTVTVAAELEALTGVGSVSVTRRASSTSRSSGGAATYGWLVAFVGNATDLGTLRVKSVKWAEVVGGACEAWTIASALDAGAAVTADALEVNLTAVEVDPYDFDHVDASPEEVQVQAQLELLPGVASTLATRSLADDEGGYTWKITLEGQHASDVSELECLADATLAVMSGASCGTLTMIDGNAVSGTYLLSLDAYRANPIAADANAAALEAEL